MLDRARVKLFDRNSWHVLRIDFHGQEFIYLVRFGKVVISGTVHVSLTTASLVRFLLFLTLRIFLKM